MNQKEFNKSFTGDKKPESITVKPAMTDPEWVLLRSKFFADCTEIVDGVPKICVAPHDCFEFFKRNLK